MSGAFFVPSRRIVALWLLVLVPGLVQLSLIYHIGWVRGWRNPEAPETYQPLVPLGALILAWVRRDRIARAARPPILTPEQEEERTERLQFGLPDPLRYDRPASLLLPAIGCVLLVFNHLWRYQELSVIALVLFTAGAAIALYGPRMFHTLRAPLAFLLLMAPLPHLITSHTSTMLQINSTALAGNLLTALHISVRVVGNTLYFHHYTLQVTQACGGLGILVQMQVLTLFLLLLRPSTLFQRVTLFSLVTLVTPLANLLRLTVMGLLANSHPNVATRLHDMNSWLFTLLLFGLTCLLARRLGLLGPDIAASRRSSVTEMDLFEHDAEEIETLSGRTQSATGSLASHPRYAVADDSAEEGRAANAEGAQRAHQFRARLLGLGLLLVVSSVVGFEVDRRVGRAGEWLPMVPVALPGWQGREEAMDWTFVDEERYLSRIYTNLFGERVQMFMIAPRSGYGYRDPRGCLRGSGYFVTAQRGVQLGKGAQTQARLLVLCSDYGHRMVMVYWQQGEAGWVSAEAPLFAYHSGTQALTELRMVGETLLRPRRSCLVRVYAELEADDPQGRQAQRNVVEVARLLYQAIQRRDDAIRMSKVD